GPSNWSPSIRTSSSKVSIVSTCVFDDRADRSCHASVSVSSVAFTAVIIFSRRAFSWSILSPDHWVADADAGFVPPLQGLAQASQVRIDVAVVDAHFEQSPPETRPHRRGYNELMHL